MANTTTDSTGATTAAEEAAIAPSSLKGWSTFQRSVNVTLPSQLRKARALLQSANSALGGGQG